MHEASPTAAWPDVLITLGAGGCALVGGTFLAFSAIVMPALTRMPAAPGIAVMQAINIAAVRPPLMIALFGTAATCVAVAAHGTTADGGPRLLLLAGSATYLVGVLGVTLARSVPLNGALAALEPHASGSRAVWTHYLDTWTRWNHARTISGLAAAVLLLADRS